MNAILRNILATSVAFGLASSAVAQSTAVGGPPTPFLPLASEPAAELEVDAPLPGPLSDRNVAIIRYRTRNFRILPIFGPAAVNVSPRVGHLHVGLDGLPWRWADAGGSDAIVLVGLEAGEHRILVELALPNHQIVAAREVRFIVPPAAASGAPHDHHHNQ